MINNINEKLSLLELFGQIATITSIGYNKGKCLCPFHAEKTPSMYIDDNIKKFHCFGCGARGGPVDFYKINYGLSFKEALYKIKSDYKIDFDVKDSINENKIYNINRIFLLDCQLKLIKNKSLLQMVNKRLDMKDILRYKIGYCDENIHLFLQKYDLTLEDLRYSKLTYEKGKNNHLFVFRNRITYNICDLYGNVRGFIGRRIYKHHIPKYLNSYNTEIFNKRKLFFNILNIDYNLDTVYVVEGLMDIFGLKNMGLNVLAIMNSKISEEQYNFIRTKFKNIIFFLDSDYAGKTGNIKAIEHYFKYDKKEEIGFISFYENFGKDPDDLNRNDDLKRYIDKSMDIMQFLIKYYNETTIEHQKHIFKTIDKIKNDLHFMDDVSLKVITNKVSSDLYGKLNDKPFGDDVKRSKLHKVDAALILFGQKLFYKKKYPLFFNKFLKNNYNDNPIELDSEIENLVRMMNVDLWMISIVKNNCFHLINDHILKYKNSRNYDLLNRGRKVLEHFLRFWSK